MSMNKPKKSGQKGGPGKGKVKGAKDKEEKEEETWSHVLAMKWMWSTDTDRLYVEQFGLDDEVNQRIFFDRGNLDDSDLEDYPDPLDPPAWLDAGEGQPKSINFSIAGSELLRKIQRREKIVPREHKTDDAADAAKVAAPKDTEFWSKQKVYNPEKHIPWEFKELLPGYIMHMGEKVRIMQPNLRLKRNIRRSRTHAPKRKGRIQSKSPSGRGEDQTPRRSHAGAHKEQPIQSPQMKPSPSSRNSPAARKFSVSAEPTKRTGSTSRSPESSREGLGNVRGHGGDGDTSPLRHSANTSPRPSPEAHENTLAGGQGRAKVPSDAPKKLLPAPEVPGRGASRAHKPGEEAHVVVDKHNVVSNAADMSLSDGPPAARGLDADDKTQKKDKVAPAALEGGGVELLADDGVLPTRLSQGKAGVIAVTSGGSGRRSTLAVAPLQRQSSEGIPATAAGVSPGTGGQLLVHSTAADGVPLDAKRNPNSWWNHLRERDDNPYKLSTFAEVLKEVGMEEFREGGGRLLAYGKVVKDKIAEPVREGREAKKLYTAKEFVSGCETADVTAELLVGKLDRMAKVMDEEVVRYAHTKDFRQLRKDVLPIWEKAEREVIVGYDNGKEGDIVKIARKFQDHPVLVEYVGQLGVLTRADAELQCWFAAFSDDLGRIDGMAGKVNAKPGSDTASKRKAGAAKKLEDLRSKLAGGKHNDAGTRRRSTTTLLPVSSTAAADAEEQEDKGVPERIFCTGHTGKYWLAFADPDRRTETESSYEAEGFERLGSCSALENGGLEDSEDLVATIAESIQAADRKMPRQTTLDRRLLALREKAGTALIPPTPRDGNESKERKQNGSPEGRGRRKATAGKPGGRSESPGKKQAVPNSAFFSLLGDLDVMEGEANDD